jgi:hypothetical protein
MVILLQFVDVYAAACWALEQPAGELAGCWLLLVAPELISSVWLLQVSDVYCCMLGVMPCDAAASAFLLSRIHS